MQNAIIVDLDGTLADITHRVHFVRDGKKDWPAFNAAMHLDKPKQDIINIVNQFDAGWYIFIVTGRFERFRKVTEYWLAKHNISYDKLLMRKDEDYRADHLIKEEIYLAEIKDRVRVIAVIDDRQSVVDMWRKNRLTCLQCQKGDY